MKERSPLQIHTKKIIDYYETAHIFYFLMWHRRSFGLHYGLWNEGIKNRFQAIAYENELLANMANIKEGERVLDAGCGVGGSSVCLAKSRGAQVVGINLVQRQLKEGQKIAGEKKYGYNVPAKTDFVKADYHLLPFTDSTFNVVWSLESIEHARSVEEFVKESWRVLKPSGRLVIAATLGGEVEPTEEQKRQLEVGLRTSGAFKDSKTAEEVGEIMQKLGFEQVQAIDLTSKVLPSARDITNMCRWGYPVAKILARVGAVSPVMVLNNEWGLYQEGLFRSGVTEYNVILGTKPQG